MTLPDLPMKLLWAEGALGRRQREMFHQYEEERIAQREATGGARPIGGRLSVSCPVRMAKLPFDPERYRTPIDEGDADRGHEWESRFRAICLLDVEHEYQPRVDWGVGVSAFDWRVPDWGGLNEDLKTTKGGRYLKSEWRETTLKRMTAFGMQPGAVAIVRSADPMNRDLHGPFEVLLTDEARDKYALQLDGVTVAINEFKGLDDPTHDPRWDDRAWWRDHLHLECTDSWCFEMVEWDATPEMERKIARYHLHAIAWAEACRDAERALGFKVKGKEYTDDGLHRQILDAAEEHAKRKGAEPGVPLTISSYATDPEYAIKRDRGGRWQIKQKPTRDHAEGVAA